MRRIFLITLFLFFANSSLPPESAEIPSDSSVQKLNPNGMRPPVTKKISRIAQLKKRFDNCEAEEPVSPKKSIPPRQPKRESFLKTLQNLEEITSKPESSNGPQNIPTFKSSPSLPIENLQEIVANTDPSMHLNAEIIRTSDQIPEKKEGGWLDDYLSENRKDRPKRSFLVIELEEKNIEIERLRQELSAKIEIIARQERDLDEKVSLIQKQERELNEKISIIEYMTEKNHSEIIDLNKLITEMQLEILELKEQIRYVSGKQDPVFKTDSGLFINL
jgi:hypothetical protein